MTTNLGNRTTLSDLAERAQVSVSTVSRALRGKPGAGPDLARRIRELADTLGYRPHPAARSLSTGRTYAIAAVVRDLPNPYYTRVLDGIYRAAREQDYSVQLHLTRNQEDIPRLWADCSDRRWDGLIIALPGRYLTYQNFLQRVAAAHLPIVLYGPTFTPFVDSVGVDYVQAGRMAVAHLVELGHQRIAHLCTPDLQMAEGSRLAGFQQGMLEHQLPYRKEWVLEGLGMRREGYRAMQELLRCDELPTGIVCHNDLAAIGAMAAIRDAGLRVPEDFSVVGFDNIEDDDFLPVKLTTVDQPAEEIGRMLVKTLLERIASPDHPEMTTVRMEARLIVRESTAPPRKTPTLRRV